MVFFQPFMFCATLAKQMGLDLVDRIEFDQIDQVVRIKVRYADCPDLSHVIQLFQFPPRSIAVAEGPVEQHQIKIAGLQFFQ